MTPAANHPLSFSYPSGRKYPLETSVPPCRLPPSASTTISVVAPSTSAIITAAAPSPSATIPTNVAVSPFAPRHHQSRLRPQPPESLRLPEQRAGGIMTETIPFKNLHSREYQGHKKKVHSVAWNCIGTKLASGSVDQTARVWPIEPHGHSKVKDVELKGHTDSVDQLCWDPKHADLIATASGDKTVRLWDVRSGKCSQQAELSGENINITYKPDGTHVAVGNRDDELTILDVRKFKPIHKRKFNYEVNEIAWNMTGDMFFLTTGNGTVEVLAYPSLRAVDTLTAHTAGCYCIAIDPLGRYFAVGSADSLVSLWDISEMLCVRTFTKLEWPVRTISFNHTGEYIASASEDLFIDISNVQTGRSVHQIPCRAAMNSVEWNPKYNLLAYAGDDKNKYQADEGVFRIFGFESA